MLKIRLEIWTKSNGEQFVVLSLANFEKVEEAMRMQACHVFCARPNEWKEWPRARHWRL